MKKIIGVLGAPNGHWVGDGFPVRSLFSYHDDAKHLSPFLMLDRAGPLDFPPATKPRGVDVHPHRGFETVSIVYKGEVSHGDSEGHGGTIGPGDVQWMTAASGILHKEFHSESFTRSGGVLDMVQLWVNLPAKDKMSKPGYQGIVSADIPSVKLADDAGTLRVIAGEYEGAKGPARTFTPMNVWDMALKANKRVELPANADWNTLVIVLHGTVQVNDETIARAADCVVLGREGTGFTLEANGDAVVLVLAGEPIDEPVVGQGPFVMNTRAEIVQAMVDYRDGKFGSLAS